MQLLQSRALPLGYPATELTLKSYRPSHPRFNQFLPQFVSENLDKALLNHEMHKSCDASEREIRNRLETAPCRMDSTKETLNKSFNHEWTPMKSRLPAASFVLVRVHSWLNQRFPNSKQPRDSDTINGQRPDKPRSRYEFKYRLVCRPP